MNPTLSQLVVQFFAIWQVRVLVGLIVLDIATGIAAALRTKTFNLYQLADFYQTMIVPYLIGYAALYVCVKLIIPPDFTMISDSAITAAWGVLTLALGKSIVSNGGEIYKGQDALFFNPHPKT